MYSIVQIYLQSSHMSDLTQQLLSVWKVKHWSMKVVLHTFSFWENHISSFLGDFHFVSTFCKCAGNSGNIEGTA